MYVAQVDENTNKVISVILVRRDACMAGGVVTQAATESHCDPRYGAGYKYYPVVSTTKNMPSAGWNYDASKDLYDEDAPFASWILDEAVIEEKSIKSSELLSDSSKGTEAGETNFE